MSGVNDNYVDHAEEERLGVFAKYDKGREEGAKIDDWEDPTFEIYHVTDRYGFIHDSVIPKVKAEEIKRLNIENDRADKWLKMIDPGRWVKFRHGEKLRRRIYKGIPNKLRGHVWGLLLDLRTIKEQQKGKYEEMLELARKYSPDVRQIDLDVNRTYRDTFMFRQRYGKEQKWLFNILCAYSVYNSEVGYCQGMSQVAALLLMYLTEEDAFWGLAQLMTNNRYGMHGFFIAGFPKLVRFQSHHDKVMQSMLTKLKKHFDKNGVDCGLYTLKWFFQCFLDRVPFELSLRLWDIFLLEGDRVLICGAYSILKIHQKQLLAKKNMDDILNYIQATIPTNFRIDNDKAIEHYKEYSEELQRKRLHTAGEPGDDELPKKPFGVIEHIPKPPPPAHPPREIPLPIPIERVTTPENNNPSFSSSEVDDEEISKDGLSVNYHIASPISSESPNERIKAAMENNIHDYSNSEAGEDDDEFPYKPLGVNDHIRIPKSVSREIPNERVTTPTENNIPGVSSSETVRIHVPYNIPSATHHQPTQVSPRNGYDINKSDPNRIIIDVTSHSTLIQ